MRLAFAFARRSGALKNAGRFATAFTCVLAAAPGTAGSAAPSGAAVLVPTAGSAIKPSSGDTTHPQDLAVTSPDPAMRRHLAAGLAEQADAHSFVLLLLMADDGDAGVRQAALEAAYARRCKLETADVCTALIAAFTRDAERDIAWQARDWLLDRDLDLALEDADKAYKLDLLAKLGGSPTIPAGPARHLLRCLSADADTDVQDNAAWLLEQQP